MSGPRAQVLGTVGAAAVAMFVTVCGAAQFLRADLDWIGAPLSAYLTGAGGALVKAAYVALSIGLGAIGLGFRAVLAPPARGALPAPLFVVAGAALSITAFSESPDSVGLHTFVHNVAAMTTFLCVTVAMLLQSWYLRLDARWRSAFAPALGLAFAAFAALWIYALLHQLPRGLAQKVVIALILAWLGWAALALRRRSAQ